MTRAEALDQLCRILAGRPPASPDWDAVIALANHALVTPRLEPHLPDAGAPEEVVAFVAEVARRNRERNLRLHRQMGEAAAVLNAIGVTPLVIKGAACLARTGGECSRLVSDVDLVVPPTRMEAALAALTAYGFEAQHRQEGLTLHAVAELARPSDVGALDVHQRPPGPPGFVGAPEILEGGATLAVGDGLVRAPDAHVHIYLQALHDQLHDGGYWRGGFDLRHAFDIADLVAQGVDWNALAALPASVLTRHALDAQLAAARSLAGAEVPGSFLGLRSNLTFARQRRQYVSPRLAPLLTGLAVALEAPHLPGHRRADRETRVRAGLPLEDKGVAARFGQLRQHLSARAARS